MTAYLIERHPVTQGLAALLATYLDPFAQVGVGEAPRDLTYDSQNRLANPYCVVYALPTLGIGAWGDLAHPDSGGRLTYQVTSVGRTDDSAGITADRVRRGLLERATNGAFVRSISAGASMTVVDRWQGELGMLVPDAGLWNVHDLFNLEVQAGA